MISAEVLHNTCLCANEKAQIGIFANVAMSFCGSTNFVDGHSWFGPALWSPPSNKRPPECLFHTVSIHYMDSSVYLSIILCRVLYFFVILGGEYCFVGSLVFTFTASHFLPKQDAQELYGIV